MNKKIFMILIICIVLVINAGVVCYLNNNTGTETNFQIIFIKTEIRN